MGSLTTHLETITIVKHETPENNYSFPKVTTCIVENKQCWIGDSRDFSYYLQELKLKYTNVTICEIDNSWNLLRSGLEPRIGTPLREAFLTVKRFNHIHHFFSPFELGK